MLKHEPGYNKASADWEFFVVKGDGEELTERGKIESCIECHRLYSKQDFVSKKYMKAENKVLDE